MQTTGYFLRKLRNRCRTWLTRATALVALCGFGMAGAQMVDIQGLDNAPPPAFLNGDNEAWPSPIAAHAGDSRVGLILIKTGTGIGNLVYAGVQCPHSARIVCSGLYDVGTTINIQAITALDSFSGWKSGPCAGTKANPCSFVLNNTTTVVAEFTEPQNTPYKDLEISIKSSHPEVTGLGSGFLQVFVNKLEYTQSCLNGCRGQFPRGTEVTIIAIPKSDDSDFGGWAHAPSSCKESSFSCTFNLTEHTALIPIFHKKTNTNTYPLELSILGAGSIYGPIPFQDGSFNPASEFLIGSEDASGSPTKILDYQSDSQVLLTPKPKEGWRFEHWNGACSGSGSCSVTMNAAKWVTASFTQNTSTENSYKLTISKTGSGTVTSNVDGQWAEPSDIDCGSRCSVSYSKGTKVALVAKAADGYRFDGWEGVCAELSGSLGWCTVTMDAATSVTAKFVSEDTSTVSLTLTIAGKGRIETSPYDVNNWSDFLCDKGVACGPITLTYNKGTKVTIKAIAAADRTFNGWYGDSACSDTSTTCTVTMDAAKSVRARFGYTNEKGNDKIITINFRKTGTGIGSILYARTDGLPATCNYFSTFCSVTTKIDQSGFNYLSAIEEIGSFFTGWRTGPCAGSHELTCEIVPIDVNADIINIEAQFDRDPRLSSSCQARHFSDIEEKVQNAYIAFYGRPADVGGLDYWDKKLTAAGGDLNLIMDEFGNSDEYRDRFSSMDDRELVNNLYMQLFARPGDDEGLDFYVEEMRKGTFTLASLAINLADGAERGGDDWKVLEGRRKVARHYVTIMEATPGGKTDFRLADYLDSAHESNADAVCDALSEAVFP